MTQESHVCFVMERGDQELASFGLKVNLAVLRVGGIGGVGCRHFYWLVLVAHWLSDEWVWGINARYAHSNGVWLLTRNCVFEIEKQR